MKECLQCRESTKRSIAKYCSNKCQLDFEYYSYINRWKDGMENGSRGIHAKNISGYIRRYMINKYNNSCSLCGWKEINITTGQVPLEIDHIDGNSDNNDEGNMRLICPNCHSLTASYRNLNKGNGREWRRDKYIKVTM